MGNLTLSLKLGSFLRFLTIYNKKNMHMTSKYDNLVSNIIEDYGNGLSIKEINEKYGIKSHYFVGKVLGEKKRNRSEVQKIAKKKREFHHSEETKEKIRKKRLEYMRLHPESTAWRKGNKPSYPEQCFINFLNEQGYAEKYLIEREYCIFPYFIDFAFKNEKIAIEIDGSQHLETDRRIKDEQKDALLIDKGWSVIRITEKTVKNDWITIKEILDEALENKPICLTKVGILEHIAVNKHKEERGEDGLTKKQRDYALRQRKVERPSKEKLVELIKTNSLVKIGKEFGVSDKAIAKWCKYYKLPSIKEIRMI